MTHQQHPIGTGFTAFSTADDVLAGIDLTGKNVVVTGGHSGLGLVATRALSRAGASVIVGSRDADRAAAAVAGIERVEVGRLDLMDPASIDAFVAARWKLLRNSVLRRRANRPSDRSSWSAGSITTQ